MRVIPALDLRDGACVQLVGGAYDAERVRLEDPAAAAAAWSARGFRALHLVDLDAATGRGSNRALVGRLLAAHAVEAQVGGGIREIEDVEAVLASGATRVVIGTRAIEDPEWLARAAGRFPGRLMVAADVRGGEVVTRGWSRGTGLDPFAVLDTLDPLPLAAVLVTVVDREGRVAGTDLDLLAALAARARAPLHAAGGIASLDDLRRLRDRGISAAILGMALYTGALDAAAVIEEFPS